MLEDLEKEYNFHKEVINSLPVNNLKNRKQYVIELDKLIKSYEEKPVVVIAEIILKEALRNAVTNGMSEV